MLPWSGWYGLVTSLVFPTWAQAIGITGPVPNWAMIDTSYFVFDVDLNDSVAVVQLGYHPATAWFMFDDTNHIPTVPIGCNESRLTVFNLGASGTFATAAVVSNDPLLPSYTLLANEVTALEQVVFTGQPFGISTNISDIGHTVPVSIIFSDDSGMVNHQIDTMLLSLPEADPWPNDWFDLPAIYNSSHDLVVVAKTWNSIAAYRNKQPLWQRFVDDSVKAIAIKADRLRIGVATTSGVYQFDNFGAQINHWFDPPTACPFVGFIDLPGANGQFWTYLWFISGQFMYYYDAFGQPPEDQYDRQQIALPFAPNGACYGLDHGQARFSLTCGDEQIMLGAFVTVDWLGQVVFPESGIVPYESRVYYPPIAGDRNADGYLEPYATYIAPNGIGGIANITYSVWEDSTAMGWWQSSGYPLPNGCGFSFRPMFNGARLIHSYVSTYGGNEWRRYMTIDEGASVRLPVGEDCYFSSVNIDGGSAPAVAAMFPGINEIRFYGSDGRSLYPGNSVTVAKLGPDTLCGPLLSIYYAPADEWQLLAPGQLGNHWRFRDYHTATYVADDWYGPNGNGANTRSHAWRGGPPECANDSSITLTLTVVNGNVALDWIACFRQFITGYNVYHRGSQEDEWSFYDHIINRSNIGSLVIPPNSSQQFFQVKATFFDVAGGLIDGSHYWGEQQQP